MIGGKEWWEQVSLIGGGVAQINLLWEGIMRSLCVQNISVNSTFSGTYRVLGSKVFVIFSQNFFNE